MIYFAIYYTVINAIGLWVMWDDKQRAKEHRWRIPEATLFLVALLGGSLGTTVGMQRFRHKTKHWYFRIGMPAILIGQLALMCYLLQL